MGAKIYVGGLPYSTTEQQLSDLFAAHWGCCLGADHYGQVHGAVSRVWICRNVVRRRSASGDYRFERHATRWSYVNGEQLVLRSPALVEAVVEGSEVIAVNSDLFFCNKGCRSFRRPFFFPNRDVRGHRCPSGVLSTLFHRGEDRATL